MDRKPLLYLIDDDVIYHSITEMLVERSPRQIDFKAFYNGREAIEELCRNGENPDQLPHLIFLDINMPIMNGWDFLEELEKIGNRLPGLPKVSMMTSSSLDRDVNKAMCYANVMEFITKPLTLDTLERLIDELEEN